MMKSTQHLKQWAMTAIMTAALGTVAQAQSVDALIDKLVEKGTITSAEAKQLREEADKDFNTAYAAKSGMPDWVTALKLNGDLRLRYDGMEAEHPAFLGRDRLRYRLRLGATAFMKDNLEVGLRLMSGEGSGGALPGSDPISGNTSFENNGSKKQVFIDLAYGKWTPYNESAYALTLIGGKMENPFVFSDAMFDADYTPEGFTGQFTYRFSTEQVLKLNGGIFALDELGASSHDPFLGVAQLRLDSAWTPKLSSSIGIAALGIRAADRLTTANVPDRNKGNTRLANGTLANDYNPIVVDASVTYILESAPMYAGVFPVRVGGEYVNNPAADVPSRAGGEIRDSAYAIGVTLGRSGRKGTWDLTYRWKTLEADAWYEEFVDSDQGAYYQTAPPGGAAGYGAGTSIRGHYLRAAYSPADSTTLSVTYFRYGLIDKPVGAAYDSQFDRLQVDVAWKF